MRDREKKKELGPQEHLDSDLEMDNPFSEIIGVWLHLVIYRGIVFCFRRGIEIRAFWSFLVCQARKSNHKPDPPRHNFRHLPLCLFVWTMNCHVPLWTAPPQPASTRHSYSTAHSALRGVHEHASNWKKNYAAKKLVVSVLSLVGVEGFYIWASICFPYILSPQKKGHTYVGHTCSKIQQQK